MPCRSASISFECRCGDYLWRKRGVRVLIFSRVAGSCSAPGVLEPTSGACRITRIAPVSTIFWTRLAWLVSQPCVLVFLVILSIPRLQMSWNENRDFGEEYVFQVRSSPEFPSM